MIKVKMYSTSESKNISKKFKLIEEDKDASAKLIKQHKTKAADTYEMFFGHNTYAEQRRQERACRSDRRTVGFEALGDEDTLAERLLKTKVCWNLKKYGNCTHKICTFAHTPEELNDPECVFGNTCRRRETCTFKHRDETSEDYRKRRGIKFPPPKLKLNENLEGEVGEGKIEYTDLVRSVLEDENVKNHRTRAQPPTRTNAGELVLRVPMEMAKAAMELAIAQNKTNIRIEVV